MFMLLFLINAFKASLGAPTVKAAYGLLSVRSPALPDCDDPTHYRALPEIIRTCITLMVSCAWSFIHPNVPNPEHSQWKTLGHKSLIFVFALAFPELIAFWALRQFLGAIKHAREYNKKFGLACPSVLSWYWYPRNSRMSEGEVVGGDGQISDSLESATYLTTKNTAEMPWTLRHGFLLEMGGLVLRKGDSEPIVVHKVSQLPGQFDLPEAHIIDSSKRPSITRAVFIFQLMWFWLQCGTRNRLRLPLTQLEWLTLTVVIFNLAAHFFWFFKPQNMNLAFELRVATDVGCDSRPGPCDLRVAEDIDKVVVSPWLLLADQLGAENQATMKPRLHLFYCLPWRDLGPSTRMFEGPSQVPLDIRRPSKFLIKAIDFRSVLLTGLIGGCSSGSLMLMSCFLSGFPSPSEKGLWTVAVVWMMVGQFLFACITVLASLLPNLTRVLLHLVGLGVLLYFVARLLLIFLAISSFRCSPLDIYLNLSFADWKTSFTGFQHSQDPFYQSDFHCY